jgi:hypothetical protein
MDKGDFSDYEAQIDGISQWSFWNDSFLSDSEPEIDGISQLSCGDLDSNIVLSVTSDMKIDGHTELYDSSAGHHISPYRNNFINFISIPPKPFRAANKGTFYATGKGDLDILVPNGSDWWTLWLTDVLYSPDVGYTLVSIDCLDDRGYNCRFYGGVLEMVAPEGATIGVIPKTAQKLYIVTHLSSNSASAAVEVKEKMKKPQAVMPMELHQLMGHVAPHVTERVFQKDLVTGLILERPAVPESNFCESCVYGKATHKPVLRI